MAEKRNTNVPDLVSDNISPTTPLRLEVAARIAFPDGSMKLASLRREIARGRLSYEVIANKHYTTLADIEEMRRLCRIEAKPSRDRARSDLSNAALKEESLSLGGPSPQSLLREKLRLSREARQSKRKKSNERPKS